MKSLQLMMKPPREDPQMRRMFNCLTIAAAVMGAATLLSPQAHADRVCKKECSAGVCKEQCVETQDRDRDRVTIEHREERHEDKPAVDLKVPGVGVEIGH
jgi:hypothetical protein